MRQNLIFQRISIVLNGIFFRTKFIILGYPEAYKSHEKEYIYSK